MEQYFNPDFFSWPLLITCSLFFANSIFMSFKFLIEQFMDWQREDYPIKLFVKRIFIDNWWVYLFCYQMLDPDTIFPTSFEYTFYMTSCLIQCHVEAALTMCQEYIKSVIDPQITQSQLQPINLPATSHKCIHLQIFLKLLDIFTFFCTIFLCLLFFQHPDCGIHAILLTYPVLRNYLSSKIL